MRGLTVYICVRLRSVPASGDRVELPRKHSVRQPARGPETWMDILYMPSGTAVTMATGTCPSTSLMPPPRATIQLVSLLYKHYPKRLTKVAALAGKACRDGGCEITSTIASGIGRTRAIAGPRPFHNAATPSAAIVLRAQSRKPEYVPDGADWIRDLRT